MKPEQYREMRALFHELVDLSDEERRRAIDAHELDPVVRERLCEMLDFPESRAVDDDVLQDIGFRVTEAESSRLVADRPSNEDREATTVRPIPPSGYEVRDRVAEGGMGAIYRAWDPVLERVLAMKVLKSPRRPRREDASDPSESLRRRFIDEARITGQLDHPGVVPIHALDVDEQGRVYFTMRLVQGMTYKEVIGHVVAGDEGWNETRAVQTLLRACETVAYAHSRGVIHRDLKPANLMVGAFGEIYVMDWGLAKAAGSDSSRDIRIRNAGDGVGGEASDDDDSGLVTMEGDVIGTPAYMPPEQARGELQHIGTPADVYAMGAILYHLLAGTAPYLHSGTKTPARVVLTRVLDGPPVALQHAAPEAASELVAICEKAMQREPGRRYADMSEMAEDLRAFLEGRVVKAHRTGPAVEMRKWVQRNRALAASMAAILLAVLAGLAAVGLVTTTKNRELSDRNEALATETTRANRERDLARSRASEVLRLADLRDLVFLTGRADELWPTRPEMIEPLRA